jgi:tetratricopeptide (TPR) repeat protein
VEADRLFQAEAWERLEPCSYDELIFLIDNCPEYQTWYVVEKLCHESEEAASDHVGRALELAKAALRAAERMPGEKAWQSQAVSYALVFLSNCPRVQGEVNEAEPTFGRARELWQAGAGAHPGLLAEWRFLDLEGSLLRDQRRFPEALERLDSALACAPREATGRILIKKAFTLEQKGENEEAIAALREAAPRVREQGDPRQLFALWFNWTANLCTLGRYTQADRLLRRVRELAAGLRKGLHDLRVRWLGALVDAGLGRVEEAISALEEVRKGFEARGMVYDSALAAVKLAELYLEQGPAAETRELAVWMEEVFRERGIEREAWAALGLFCEAARQEGATAEWARRLFDYLQRARHDPALPFAG